MGRNNALAVVEAYEYGCAECDYVAASERAVAQHGRQAHAEAVPCAVCGKPVKTLSGMARHVRAAHPDPAPEVDGLVCPECGKVCASKAGLSIHLSAHRRAALKRTDAAEAVPASVPAVPDVVVDVAPTPDVGGLPDDVLMARVREAAPYVAELVRRFDTRTRFIADVTGALSVLDGAP